MVHLVVMWRRWDISWWFISLESQYGNVVAHRIGSWSICLLTFYLICHNCGWIWKMILHTHVGLAIQPSVGPIIIFGCGHFLWVLDKIIPTRWESTCFHKIYSWEIIVKLYDNEGLLGLWLYSTKVPHFCPIMGSAKVILQYVNVAPILLGLYLQHY